mmetsp:Transcript_5130/g.10826  ORF Transcript_5130/g.10826 Transcript_5130/m.10826 type:complete len:96 (-) Transcript_5130:80-367(-)
MMFEAAEIRGGDGGSSDINVRLVPIMLNKASADWVALCLGVAVAPSAVPRRWLKRKGVVLEILSRPREEREGVGDLNGVDEVKGLAEFMVADDAL